MTRETLKRIRLATPAIMLIVVLLPIWSVFDNNEFIKAAFGKLSNILYLAILVSIGSIYNIIDIRHYFNSKFSEKVKTNIRTKLWEAARQGPVPQDWTDSKARDTFYRIIDNDQTLTARSELIYHNGALWTASADAKAIGIFGILISLGILVSGTHTLNAFASLCLVILLFAYGYLTSDPITEKHIRLGTEQLDYIKYQKRDELEEFISKYGL